MTPAERIRIGRLEEPSELSLWPGPEHEVKDEGRAGFSSLARRVGPRGSGTYHQFDRAGKRERFLEENVRLPFGLPLPEQRTPTDLDLQPLLDDAELNRGRWADTKCAAGESPFPLGTDGHDRSGLLFLRACQTQGLQ